MKTKRKNILAWIMINVMLFSQILPVYAEPADGYPSSTSNKNDIATIEKSASWNGVNAYDADYKASITLDASVRGDAAVSTSSPADIILVLDNSGSMASCNNPDHITLNAVEGAWIKPDVWDRIVEEMIAASKWTDSPFWTPGTSTSTVYVWEDSQKNNYDHNTYYIFPKKTSGVSIYNSGDWYIGQIEDSNTLLGASHYLQSQYIGAQKSKYHAPYSFGHVKMSGGQIVNHIVADDNGIYRLSAWSDHYLPSMSPGSGGSADGATTSLYEAGAPECHYVFDVSEETTNDFIRQISDAYQQEELGDTNVSVIGFAGKVSNYSTNFLDISDAGNVNALQNSVTNFYASLGAQTNWGAAMQEVRNKLATGNAEHKFVVFYTDGNPDSGDYTSSGAGAFTQENYANSLAAAKQIYNDYNGKVTFYGIFMRNSDSTSANLNNLISCGNSGSENEGGNPMVKSISSTATVEDAKRDLQGYWNEIFENVKSMTRKSVIAKSVKDTVSDKFIVGSIEEILAANPQYNNSDYTITVNGQTVTITFNKESIQGVEDFVIPVTLKEEYRNIDELTYYPTNQGDATIEYIDLDDQTQSLGTPTPYLPIAPINVSYEWVGDDKPSDVEPPEGDTIIPGTAYTSKAQDPTSEDYRFDGWYLDQELTKEYVDGTRLVEDTILYGKWIPLLPPDLKVVKSSDPESGTLMKKGEKITYTLTATNAGEVSTGIPTIVDNIPEGTTYVAGSAASNNDQVEILDQTAEKGRIVWNLPVLKSGDTIEVSFQVIIDIDEGLVKNAALYGDSEDPEVPMDPDDVNKETNEVEHPVRMPNLNVVKTAVPETGTQLRQGDTITYILTASNTGEVSTGIPTIVDYIPEGTTYVAGSAAAGNDQVEILDQTGEKGRIVWNLPVMEPGDTIEVSFQVTVDIERGIVKNAAVYGDSENPDVPMDPDTPDKKTNEVEHPVIAPVLNVVKSSDPESGTLLKKGETITYTLTASNTGDASTGVVTITDNIPEGTTYVADSAAADNDQVEILDQTGEKGRIVWNLPVMKPGDTMEVSFQVTVDIEEGTVKNAAVYGDSQDPEVPMDPDDVDKETNEVEHPVRIPGLNVIKSSDPKSGTQVKKGETITYTLTASNTGAAPTGIVTIVDNIPQGTTYIANSAASDNTQVEILNQSAEKGRIVWNLPVMEPGDTIKVSFQVTVNIEKGTVKNVAVYGDSGNPEVPMDPDDVKKATNEVKHPASGVSPGNTVSDGKPGNPGNPGYNSAGKTALVKTGDTSNVLPYCVVMMVSLGLLGFAASKRKKALKK